MAILTEQELREPNPRLVAFGNMLKHLGIDPGPKQADLFIVELREAMRCCAECPIAAECAQWVSNGNIGTPPTCDGRRAFRKLMLAQSVKGVAATRIETGESATVINIADYGRFTGKKA